MTRPPPIAVRNTDRPAAGDPGDLVRVGDLVDALDRAGVSIIRKNLWETYIGGKARHPVRRHGPDRLVSVSQAAAVIQETRAALTVPGVDLAMVVCPNCQNERSTSAAGGNRRCCHCGARYAVPTSAKGRK